MYILRCKVNTIFVEYQKNFTFFISQWMNNNKTQIVDKDDLSFIVAKQGLEP